VSEVTIVGGGLAGSLLALMLARRGVAVTVFERRADPHSEPMEEGRSINLALSARGIHALARVGLDGPVLARAVPMRGRLIHPVHGEGPLIPYGRTPVEVIHSVSRAGLNVQLLDALAGERHASVHFHRRCTGYEQKSRTLTLRDGMTGRESRVEAPVVIGADGAGSAVRLAMMLGTRMDFSQEWLAHGYKELTIPAAGNGGYRMEPHALHVWPRGGFMMIALPNRDGTFTGTLFLAHAGDPSFDALRAKEDVRRFFATTFPDAAALLPDLEDEFFANPTGGLLTVRCAPWHVGGQALLIGDAAHAIVPFFGQGMNAAFEDCEAVLDLFDECQGRWDDIFPRVFARRKANSDAIARLALANFIEMRDTSADPRFALKRQLEHALEARHPGRFSSKYAMVSFQRVPYTEALERGERQDAILMDICTGPTTLAEIDVDAAFARLEADRPERTGSA
jgi:kynurenine 3-monooxygenase